MYWNSVQSQRRMSSQNWRAVNPSRTTTEPPPTSTAPVASTPPTLWYIGRELYILSPGRVSIMPANQWLHCISRKWLIFAALGSPVVPEVYMRSARSSTLSGLSSAAPSLWPAYRSMSTSIRGNEPGPAPCAQTCVAPAGPGSAVASRSMNSAATMMCLGATILMQCASEGPTRLVLSSDTTAPTRVTPSQIAMYSGRFGMSRQTVSPLARPCSSAQRAYRFERSASAR